MNYVWDILQMLGQISGRAVITGVLVCFIHLIFRRMKGKYKYILCILAFLAFLIPPSVQITYERPMRQWQEAAEGNGNSEIIQESVLESDTDGSDDIGKSFFKEKTDWIYRRSISFWQRCVWNESVCNVSKNVAEMVWIFGMLLLAARQTVRYWKMKQCLREAVKVSEHVWSTDQILSPVLFGVVRPQIYLPVGMTEKTSLYAIRHEQMHLRRNDSQVKLIAFLLCMVYWWNPVIWLLYTFLAEDMELACDEAVLELEETSNVSYAQAILDAERHRAKAVCGLAFAEGGTKMRVEKILGYKRGGCIQRYFCIIMVIALLGILILQPVAEELSPEDVWMELAAEETEYPDLLECQIYEDMESGYRESQGTLWIQIVPAQSWSRESELNGIIVDLAGELLERCDTVQEVYVGWREKKNPELWPFLKEYEDWGICVMR